jgi:hypothetical protein
LARSYANATACPRPTDRVVTAGFVVAVVALEYSMARDVAPFRVYRSAVLWNWIVWFTMPAPGVPAAVFTSR